MIGTVIRWGVVLGFGALAFGCGDAGAGREGDSDDDGATSGIYREGAGADLMSDDVMSDGEHGEPGEEAIELGQSAQAWWSFDWNQSSCSDPTGTDSVLAALAVATARELGRWQPEDDFKVSLGRLVLTSTGQARCADGQCWNTRALLDLQSDSARSVQVRPGVNVDPRTLRIRLTWNHDQQRDCLRSLWRSCRTPAHQFRFLTAEPGACDMNYWFEVRKPDGSPLGSNLDVLKKALIWVDIEDNSYIKFQSDGTTIAIDPTYGLNPDAGAKAGSCSPSCTRVASSNISGQCCSCNGTRKYARSSWNANTYLCK